MFKQATKHYLINKYNSRSCDITMIVYNKYNSRSCDITMIVYNKDDL